MDYAALADDELMRYAAADDAEAFDALVYRFLQPLYRFAYSLVHNADEASDVAQEAFIKAWKYRGRYHTGHSVKTWLFTIAHNTAIDHLRKRRSITFSDLSGDDETPFADTISDEKHNPELLHFAAEQLSEVEHAVDQLPPKYREVVVLHYTQGLTFDQIGKIMHEPLDTVKSRHRRALIKLKGILGAQ